VQRVVTRLPLADLWDDAGSVRAAAVRDLTADDIRGLLRDGPVRFVVADLGAPLRWVSAAECFPFWKAEVRSRVANPAGADLQEYPGGWCFFASEWGPVEGPPIVLLAVAH
jgi:hypothetical protein